MLTVELSAVASHLWGHWANCRDRDSASCTTPQCSAYAAKSYKPAWVSRKMGIYDDLWPSVLGILENMSQNMSQNMIGFQMFETLNPPFPPLPGHGWCTPRTALQVQVHRGGLEPDKASIQGLIQMSIFPQPDFCAVEKRAIDLGHCLLSYTFITFCWPSYPRLTSCMLLFALNSFSSGSNWFRICFLALIKNV